MSNIFSASVKQILLLALLTGTMSVTPEVVWGQVGHRPASSPYQPIRARKTLYLTAGVFGGSAGRVGVGPKDGTLIGAKFGFHPGGPVEFILGLGSMSLDRTLIDPTQDSTSRTLEIVSQTVTLWDVGVAVRLTGAKSWHHLAPYVGLTVGIASGSKVRADTLSGFGFSTQFQFGPQAGVLWYLSDKINLRFEARDVLWRLKYPDVFFATPVNAPGEPSILNGNIDKNTQWVHHPLLTVSLGYAFGF